MSIDCMKYGRFFWVWKVKPALVCLFKFAFFPLASTVLLHWFQKEVRLYGSLWENDPTFHLNFYLCKQFPNEFIVSTDHFNSSLWQHDIDLVNDDPTCSGVEIKAGHDCLVIDKLLSWPVRVLPISYKWGHVRLQ